MERLQRSRRRLKAQQQREKLLRELHERVGNGQRSEHTSSAGQGSLTKPVAVTTPPETQSTFSIRTRYRSRTVRSGTGTSRASYTPGETKLSGPRDLQPTSHPGAALAAQAAREVQKTLNELYGHCKNNPPRPPPFPHVTSLCYTLR
ncbi:ORF3 [torque teno Delphinidae virus 52]